MFVIIMVIVAAAGVFLAATGSAIGGPLFVAGIIGAALVSRFQ